ncbi:glycosyl transferase [Prauserella marina]|uniref:glycosyltransferase family 4 protein n=1 Tax=Prauserella marina TaxID=530584 RepID=UPI000B84A861|nr:glycosyltransferase family 1 protein [Prauserella marina]ASR34279.1 glycosyl transferase [Prauserella marina]
MRELVVIAEQLLAPVPGGTGRYTAELLSALAETAPDGWRPRGVVAWHTDVEAARVEGVSGPRRLPLPPKALIAAWQAGLPLWPGGAAVHAPTPLAPPRVPGRRTLSVTVHDTVPWTHPETLTPRGVRWHRSAIATAARSATALVVPTAAVAADLAGLLTPRAGVHVVRHGVTRFPPPIRTLPFDLPERYVLAVGTIEPRKGIDVLIEAMAEVPVPLLLVGQPGWGELDPSRLAALHGLPPGRVRQLGRLPDDQLAAVLRAASVVAVPSRAEGFGLPVLEAMAEGVPVVHTDVASLVEVAGEAGWIVPVGDPGALASALRDVLGSSELAARLAEAGLRRAARFSWAEAASAVWRLHTHP